MYNYTISTGNPEGTDWTLNLLHEQRWSQQSFDDLVERLFAEFIKTERPKKLKEFRENHIEDVREEVEEEDVDATIESMVSNSGLVFNADEYLIEELEKLGFIHTKYQATYYMEPYWGVDGIKNPDLKKYLSR